MGIGPVGQDQAIGRHGVDELAEGLGDLIEVAVDIGVVEFDIVDDEDFGQIVEEFGPLGEEGAVVFVAFNDKMLALAEAVGAIRALRQARDEEGGIEATGTEEVGGQRGSRGFAVRAGDDDRALAADKEIAQHFRQREIGDFGGECGFDLGITARNGVADDDHIGRGLEVFSCVALVEFDPQAL